MPDMQRLDMLINALDPMKYANLEDSKAAEIFRLIKEEIGYSDTKGVIQLERLQKLKSRDKEWLDAFYRATSWIEIRGGVVNTQRECAEEARKKFNVNINENVLDTDKGPLIFWAEVYIDEKLVTRVRCIITEKTIDGLPITNRSLSKRASRRRRIGEYWQSFLIQIQSELRRMFDEGNNMSDVTEIRF